jgi:hypothetical protein
LKRYLYTLVAAVVVVGGSVASGGAQGPSPAQIQAAIRNLLASDANVTGAWTFPAGVTAPGAPTDAPYITKTCVAGLSAEQCLSALGTGLMVSTTTTGVVSTLAPTDDNVVVGSGTAWALKALTTCTGNGKAVTYDASTNAFSCNDILGTANTWTAAQSFSGAVEINGACTGCGSPGGDPGTIQYNNSGAFGGFGSWDGTTLTPGKSLDWFNATNTTDFRRWRAVLPDASDVLEIGATADNGTGFTPFLHIGSNASVGPFRLTLYNSRGIDLEPPDAGGSQLLTIASTGEGNRAAELTLAASGAMNIGVAQINFAVGSGATAQIYLDPADDKMAFFAPGDVYFQSNGGEFEWTGATASVFDHPIVASAFRSPAVAFAALPTCNGGTEGTMQAVTDSTTATWGATITGMGGNHVLAYCNGTNWTVAAK